jgi:hypothetical protein
MKKKVSGVKIGTVISAILCVIAALICWFVVEYSGYDGSTASTFANFWF